jgi:hypothetical protein
MPAPLEPEAASGPGQLREDVPGATWACAVICATSLAIAVGMVLTSNHRLWYDEYVYLESVPELHRLGLTAEWLNGIPGAAGPLYALVHAVLEPLTGLRAPAIRLATVGMTLLTIAALGAAMRARRIPHAYPKALGLLAFPMLYGTIGTAMTEMPAALFFCVSQALLFAAVDRAERGARGSVALGALAGLACALAVAGRQHYLTGPIAALLMMRRAIWRPALAYTVVAIGLPTPMFLLWGGLVPPVFAAQHQEGGISLAHGLMALSYGGVCYCLVDIAWILRHWGVTAAVIALTTAVNVATGMLDHTPMRMTAVRLLSPTALHYYGLVASGAMLGFGVAFLVHLARIAWRRRDDAVELYLATATAMLLAAPAKILHLFSGRYIATALPLLLILGTERAPDTYGKALRFAIGCLAGLVSLHGYLNQ